MLATRLLARADIELAPMRPLLESATKLAISLDHPAYDCIYLALAVLRGCEFVTADESLARKALSAGFTSNIIALGKVALS